MEYTLERNNRLISLGITILFAALLFIIFLFIKFITPIPPFDESPIGGIQVNFGFNEEGMGDNNSLQPVSDNQKNKNASQPETNSPSEMLASEEASNVTAPPVKKNKKPDVKETPPTPDQNLLSALNKINSKTGNNSSDGNDKTPGNKGSLQGTLNSNVYSEFDGPPGGPPGLKGRLKGSGRKMIGDVAIYDDSQETGIVAVEILVDKYGKIIKAEPVLIGSTTTSSLLWKKAKDGLLNKVLFNQSPTGEEARGTIYINFTVR